MAANLPFNTFNIPASTPTPAASSETFTLTPGVPTDIWRKPGPPEISTFNAPIIYKKISLSSFKRARVTVTADWETLYDQGGLVFLLPGNGGDLKEGKWIKTGIEFYSSAAYVSTVVKDRWADWSLVQAGIVDKKEVTLEMERNETENTLWIYVVVGGGERGTEERIPLREVTWILSEKDQELLVGVYAAKPTAGGNGDLVVKFRGWELETLA